MLAGARLGEFVGDQVRKRIQIGPGTRLHGGTLLLQRNDRIVAVQNVAGEDMGDQVVVKWDEKIGASHDPIAQGRAGQLDAVTAQDGLLPVQGQVIGELRDQHMGQQSRCCHALLDGRRRQGCHRHFTLAGTAGVLGPPGFEHLQCGGNVVEFLGDELADHVARTTAAGAGPLLLRQIRRASR